MISKPIEPPLDFQRYSKCTIKANLGSDISQVFEEDDILRMWGDILNDHFLL